MEHIADGAVPSDRASRWDGLVLRASGALGVLTAAWFVLSLVEPTAPVMLSWPLSPVFFGVAAWVCWRTGSAGHVPPPARRFWRWVAVGLAVLGVSMVSRVLDALNPDLTLTSRMSVYSALGHALGAVILMWPVYRLPSRVETLAQRVGMYLDVAALTLGTSVFLWHFALGPMVAESVELTSVVTAGATLLLGGVTAVFVATKLAFAGSGTVHRRALLLLGVALAVGTLGAALRPLVTGGSFLDASLLPFGSGCFLVALGAHLQRTQPATEAGGAEDGRRRFSLLPYAAIAATDTLLLATLPSASVRDRMIVGVIAVLLTGVVVVRQIAAQHENGRLVERLHHGMLELRMHEQRFRSLVQNSYDVVMISQPDGRIDYMSGGSQRMFGRKPDQRAAHNVLDLIHPDDRAFTEQHFADVAAGPGSSALLQTRLAHADGSWRWIEVLSTNLMHEPAVNGILSNSRDVSEARELQDRLSYEATHDMLTGLANRTLFHQRVEDSAASADAGHRLSIVLIDLDNFKTVNDMLGHAVGDALLVSVAERMRHAVRPGDTVARLGGDEFAILLDGIVAGDVDRVIERMIAGLRQPVYVEGHTLGVQASFGVVDGASGDDAGELLRHADIAMYEAKARGDGGWQHFRPGMEARGADQNRLAGELRHALTAGELRVYYQPVVSLPHGVMTGVEALVRWEHPERGLVPPLDFIPLAEQTGLILPLGRWVLREACRQAAAWRREYGDRAPNTMSVNVSARQLQDAAFAGEVMSALLASGLEARRLTIEITESTAVGGGSTHETLARLRELGVKVALDDFGTGQSTLSLLASCPVDQIKLDRSFAPEPAPDVIATAVVELGRVLGLEVVAEGVENAAQAGALHELGYLRAQGFHFARPMPAEDITAAIGATTALRGTVGAA